MNSDSPNTADIVERLLHFESSGKFTSAHGNDVTTCWYRNPDGPEAAAIITELRELVERALPFVADYQPTPPRKLEADMRAALKDHRKAQAHERH